LKKTSLEWPMHYLSLLPNRPCRLDFTFGAKVAARVCCSMEKSVVMIGKLERECERLRF
jgi:hypothetical protein